MSNPIMSDHDVPDYLHPFLTDSGSLTKKLKHMTGEAVVKVLTGEFKSPDWWCQNYLQLRCDKLFQREILMTSGGHTCWYARSYIPASTWYVHYALFEQLASKNLGDILFDSRHIQRISSQFFAIGREDIPFYWPPNNLVGNQDPLWLRLSQFSINKQANFYLTELFLSELKTCLLQSGQLIGG